MFGEGKSLVAAAVATLLIGATANAAPNLPATYAQPALQLGPMTSLSDLQRLRDESNGTLLAIGQLEAISSQEAQLRVLGQDLKILAGTQAAMDLTSLSTGDLVAVFGEDTPYGAFVWSAKPLANQYVPGASPVFVSGPVSAIDAKLGLAWIGGLAVAYAGSVPYADADGPSIGDTYEVLGTQPMPGGVLLAQSMTRSGASVGTGKSADASVGTGRGASVGTGKSADASVGTGRGASVGTGKSADASVGTGRGASVGTGKSADASVGTGRSASVGTGRNASVGTGKSSK